jgi:hypothetical protein
MADVVHLGAQGGVAVDRFYDEHRAIIYRLSKFAGEVMQSDNSTVGEALALRATCHSILALMEIAEHFDDEPAGRA